MMLKNTKSIFIASTGLLLLTLSSTSNAEKTIKFSINDKMDSASASFMYEAMDKKLNIMVEFGYFETKVKGNIKNLLPPPGVAPSFDNDVNPFLPENSKSGYLILNIGPQLPPKPPVSELSEPFAVPKPPGPPGPPNQNEVLFFDLTEDDISVYQKRTIVKFDSCSKDVESMYFPDCGVISVRWKNNDMERSKDIIHNNSYAKEGILGYPMEINGRIVAKYSSANVTLRYHGDKLTNKNATRISTRSKQAFKVKN